MVKCSKCKNAALYLQPGFAGAELSFCIPKQQWRDKGCKHGIKGKPKRASLGISVDISGNAAVYGYNEVDLW